MRWILFGTRKHPDVGIHALYVFLLCAMGVGTYVCAREGVWSSVSTMLISSAVIAGCWWFVVNARHRHPEFWKEREL